MLSILNLSLHILAHDISFQILLIAHNYEYDINISYFNE